MPDSSPVRSSPRRRPAASVSSSDAAMDVFDFTEDDTPVKTTTKTPPKPRPPLSSTASSSSSSSTSRQLTLDQLHSTSTHSLPPASSKPSPSSSANLSSSISSKPATPSKPGTYAGRRKSSGSSLTPSADDDDDEYTPLSSRSRRPTRPALKLEERKEEDTVQPLPSRPPPPPAPRSRKRNSSALAPPSSDPSIVLRYVKEAVDRMRREEASKVTPTLASLNLPNVKREVLMMEEDAVRLQIEKLIVHVTASILSEEGFAFDVPVRGSGNQLFVPEINRIVLKDKVSRREFASFKHSKKAAITARVLQLVYELCSKRIHVTKRDLFYTDVKLFTKQDESDDVLDDCAAMIGCTRTSLNVVASEKGIVVGRVQFYDDGDYIDCTKMGVGGKAIPPYIERITGIQGDAKFVLLVEKDAAFMRLAEDRFYNSYPCVIITAKGQPDVATRLFLKKLKETLRIPILGLVDSDPYGLKILSVYLSGSKNMSYDSASLTTPDIQWLGVRPSDLDRYAIPAQCRLEMTVHDVETGRQMLEEEFIQKNPAWLKELELMVERKEKAEIQALSSFGFQFLTQVFLPAKLQAGDWI